MEYTIEKVDIKEKKSGEKNGRKWSFIPVGIRTGGKWYSGAINDDRLLQELKEGSKVDLILYEEEFKGTMYGKFKFPTETDKLKTRIDRVEKGLATLYNNPKIKELLNN